MIIFNQGQAVLLGDEMAARAPILFTTWQRFALLVLGAAAVLSAFLWIIDPRIFASPSTIILILLTSLVPLIPIMAFRHAWGLVDQQTNILAALFDRTTYTLEVTFYGFLGVTREHVSFSDVQAIRVSRGQWNGASVTEVPIVVLESGRTIVMPDVISPRDLALLKVLTGLRRS